MKGIYHELLDTLYFRKGLPVQDELELDGVDFEKLGKLAVGYPKRVRDKADEISQR